MIIAQISDIHAAAANDNLCRLERALAWLDTLVPDALVLSGDLIDNDEIEGYPVIASRLARRPYPAYVLPGNADNRAAMRATIPAPYWTDEGRKRCILGWISTDCVLSVLTLPCRGALPAPWRR
ncbi:metallophosphoesterase [Sodalis sp. (in: enterobacteria)]|uniref:metallophosphoesterase n=1 Tax=Sodalis sp. (in: enterobacteria) TaxID=1898979 RepID=UPI003F6864B0